MSTMQPDLEAKSNQGDVELREATRDDMSTVQKEGTGGTNTLPSYDDAETNRIIRKIDIRLMPLLTLLYLLSFLDRSNIGNARIAGMDEELGLTGSQYNIATMVFFFTYAAFEIPSNIVLKHLRPSIWVCIIVCTFGTVVTLQGLVQTYGQLVATRTLLGLAESGFGPAAAFILTIWYCRFEIQTRLSIYLSAGALAGALSGLLAFAIENMDGVGGLGGWRWIFILEGLLTVAVGVTLPWTLPDYPETASFLTPYEREFIARRLKADSGTTEGQVDTNEKFRWSHLTDSLKDVKLYVASLIQFALSVCLYAFTYTIPTIINRLGYASEQAQLMTIPVYICGMISSITLSWLADRKQVRWIIIVGPASVSMVGFIGLLAIPHPNLPGLTYALLFTIPIGIYPTLSCILAWVMNNLAPSSKRAVGMALFLACGSFGGVVGSNIFISHHAPRFFLGYGFGAGLCVTAVVGTLLLRFMYSRQNKKRDRMDPAAVREQYTEEELLKLGDASPLYRYVL